METLVASSLQLASVDLSALAQLTQCADIERPTPTVARFLGASPTKADAIAQFAKTHQIDVTWVNLKTRFADFGLIVCDMDATFIAVECIDEIAALLNLKPAIAAITQQAMCGHLDFTEALTQRVALLKGVPVASLNTLYETQIRLTPGAQTLVQLAHEHHLRFMLLSGGFTYFAQRLQADYQLDFAIANTLEIAQGKLTGYVKPPIIDGPAKAAHLTKMGESLGLTHQQIIAIGDGANDVPMFQKAGVSIAYHAKPRIAQAAHYALQYSPLDTVRWLFG